MQKLIRWSIDLILLVAFVAGGYWVYANHNKLLDWYYLSNYTPPARISALADQAGLSEKGRNLFYRGQPVIEPDRAALVRDCRIESNKTVELGCYLTNNRIYLLDIHEPDLAGQIAATAAHETLHSAYDRLSGSERRRIDGLVEKAASQITDTHLRERLEIYAETEPGQRQNELHSILATEYANLPPELEIYYRQYFTDRSKVVALSRQFTQTFDGLRGQIDQLDSSIRAMRIRMNSLLASKQIGAYNQLVPIINDDITTYNQKVELYNRYASELLGPESSAAPQ